MEILQYAKNAVFIIYQNEEFAFIEFKIAEKRFLSEEEEEENEIRR